MTAHLELHALSLFESYQRTSGRRRKRLHKFCLKLEGKVIAFLFFYIFLPSRSLLGVPRRGKDRERASEVIKINSRLAFGGL